MRAAQVDGGVVVRAIVGDPVWAADRLGGTWVATEGKVGIGWTYSKKDGFRPPRPFASWSWQNGAWTPPTPMPDDGEMYVWDEEALGWVSVDAG